MRPLLGQPNVTLLVNAEVQRLETDPAGRSVTSVVVRRGGRDEVYEGDIVAVAARAANSAAILLRSVSDRYPEGLAKWFGAGRIPIAGVAHQAGTCRFGNDPATSVLDANCKAHELDNLYVVDTSFFPSIGAVNPALTAMANAIRVGEHLLGRMS